MAAVVDFDSASAGTSELVVWFESMAAAAVVEAFFIAVAFWVKRIQSARWLR